MTYEPVESIPSWTDYPIFLGVGSPFTLFKQANELRLGFEIVKLAGNPATRADLRVSAREEAGIGIDSDLPAIPFPPAVLTRLGDYHRWSALHKYNWPVVDVENSELRDSIDRVRLMLSDEYFTKAGLIMRARQHSITGKILMIPTPSPAKDFEYTSRLLGVTSEEKIRALDDPRWRWYVKFAALGGVDQILRELHHHRQKTLEELADISEGKPVLETAAPRLDTIERLLQQYIEQMQN